MSADNKDFTPMEARGTVIYLGRSGGFDVRDCPEPESLAAFIVASCNAAAIAPPVAAGSVDTESRKLAVKFDKEAREQRQRAEKAEAELAQSKTDAAAWERLFEKMRERAEKAEARAARLEHFFKHHSLLVPPQLNEMHIVGDSIPSRKDQYPNAIDPSDMPC